ncbi:DUF3298 and DUF4163 domain-containing protein [Desulfolucanica intricata]|uniref:DUF3298 and DUF4163 domain-containing protein n=1 Tax=Desulfolucanica intricata TaxID=1285191 RepID=UPI00082F4AA7|nr:DUF3298 and DUF4163 domain-containing protein [Desulfolucanica intricata]
MIKKQTTASLIENRVENQCTNVSYPQIQGLKNKEIQEKINELIRKQIAALIPKEGCDVYEEILGVYEVKLNKKGILSIRFEFYTFPKQAANGLTVVKSITANLETGEIYQLHDLFKINSDYKILISNMIKEQIKEKDLPLINEFQGITDYEEFYLTENALVIYFQLYEYTPHSVGIPEFEIPYTKIKNLINDRGPIVRQLK